MFHRAVIGFATRVTMMSSRITIRWYFIFIGQTRDRDEFERAISSVRFLDRVCSRHVDLEIHEFEARFGKTAAHSSYTPLALLFN